MKVLITNLARIGDAEARFFRELVQAFQRVGWDAVFWSTVPCPRLGCPHIPFDWDLGNALRDQETTGHVAVVDPDKWLPRLQRLIKQSWPTGEESQILERLICFSGALLDREQPGLLLSWNPHCPHTGVAADLCRMRGIPTALIERGMLPDTWYLSQGGLIGHDPTAGRPLTELGFDQRERSRFQRIGRRYINSNANSFVGREKYDQQDGSRMLDRLELEALVRGGPRVVFFPPDDGTVGFTPANHADRRASLPHHTSSLHASLAIAHQTDGTVVFKPHPSWKPDLNPQDAPANHHIIDCDYNQLIDWSDVVAGSGSGLQLLSLIRGKPVVAVGSDVLCGKRICLEPDPNQLGDAVAEAVDGTMRSNTADLDEFVGWLLCQHCVTLDPHGQGWRTAEQAVSSLLEDFGLNTGNAGDKMLAGWRQSHGNTDMTVDLNNPRYRWALLDVDHTLLLGNSTEAFLNQAFPRGLTWLIDRAVFYLHRSGRLRWIPGNPYRDQVRVMVIVMLSPWNLLLWQWRGRRIGASLLNKQLASLAPQHKRQVIAVSNGYGFILRPMLRGAGIRWPLIASKLNPFRATVRKKGKLKSIRARYPDIQWDAAICVSDSMEDAECLAHCGRGHLRTWADKWQPSPAYFPLRFTSRGKYDVIGVVRNVLLSDWPLVLLAFVANWSQLGGVSCLFFAMYVIYEWGYFGNQYGATKSEPDARKHRRHDQFRSYPIYLGGLLWALILSAGGLTIMDMLTWPVCVTWAAGLTGLAAVFWIYNHVSKELRIYAYPALQLPKYFVIAAVLPLPLLGALLLLSQVVWQTAHYWVYRLEGRESRLPRVGPRILLFLTLAIPLIALVPGMFEIAARDWWRAVAIVAVLPFLGKVVDGIWRNRRDPIRGWMTGMWQG